MKEICGFLDKRNKFHRTEAEANKADVEYEDNRIIQDISHIVYHYSLNDYDTRERLRDLVNQLTILPKPPSSFISRAKKRLL